jgi:hypothetical protein
VLTPISALIAAIVARVLDRRQRDSVVSSRVHVSVTTGCAPVPEDPELTRMADAWREPEAGG